MIKNKRKLNGFTLIEILLVIGVIMIMSIIKIRDINEETEDMQAKMLANQIQTVAEATNAFLVLKYNELSTLSSTGVSCNKGTNTCNITLQNLNDNALLPPNFSSTTILGNPYEIQLKRTGSSPNYMMSGLVLTKGVKNTENKISLIFSGKVLRKIGRDGGLNKNKGNIIGTSGGWSADSNLFPVLSDKVNYIGSAVGTLSGAYYVYLRRDGSLPMTGDLNMDGHNIKNVNNLTATGTLTTNGDISGSNISAGGNLSATGNANINGTINSNQRITGKEIYSNSETYTNNWFRTMGDGGIYFQKYGGGWNMTDANTITAYNGKNIQTTAGLYGGYVKSTGNIDVNGTLNSGNIVASGNIVSSNNVKGNTLESTGRSTVGEFIQLNGQGTAGLACSTNGLISRSSNGDILICKKSIWRNISVQNIPPQEIYCRSQLDGSLYTDHYAKIDANGNIMTRTIRTGYGDTGWKNGSSSVSYGITNVISTGISGRTLTYRAEQGEYVCLKSWVRD